MSYGYGLGWAKVSLSWAMHWAASVPLVKKRTEAGSGNSARTGLEERNYFSFSNLFYKL
jgi:hypothetical protein